MRTSSIIIVFLSLLLSSCGKDSHNPDSFLTKEQQQEVIKQSVRYSAKLAPQATHETKFDTTYNWYYERAKKEYDIRACKPDNAGGYYFLMTRKARSIWPAREAIGGRFAIDAQNKLIDYYEEFRTWKMTEDSLNNRAFELFDLMTEKKDLTGFRSKYKGDKYIEFPDDRWYFNKEKKRWRDRYVDSIDSTRIDN